MGLSVRDADTLAAVCHAAQTSADFELSSSEAFVLSDRDGGGWRMAIRGHLQRRENPQHVEDERRRVEEAKVQTCEVLSRLLAAAEDRVAALEAPTQQWWESAEYTSHAQHVPRWAKAVSLH
jgi:hypothetical protein